MSLEHCGQCSTDFAVGLLRCPQCQAPAPLFADRMQEDPMAKITVGGGVSNAAALPGEPGYIEPPAAETETGAEAAEPVAEDPAEPSAESPAEPAAPSEDAPTRPATNAPKADWTTYQVARGLDADEANGMTKAALQAWEPPAATAGEG